MANFGRPNAKGRSSGIHNGTEGKRLGPPEGESFIWLTKDLLESAAWRLQSRNCFRLVSFLLAEHARHAGQENGRLPATYDQLDEAGLPRSAVSNTIREAEFLGLVRCAAKGGRYGRVKDASRYRLTFYPVLTESGVEPATNEWKGITIEMFEDWNAGRLAEQRASRKIYLSRPAGWSPVDHPDGLQRPDLKVVD